ncbi:unnamed protein product [Coccothraustes coccothraustes]
MAQWQEVQSLANTYLEQVHQLYAGSALPMAVRQSLAAWIESQNWRQAAEPLCSHARMLFHSLLVLLGERLGSLGSDREDFMLQHNLRKAQRDLQAEFEEKPETFANLVANLLQEERRILRLGQAGGQGGSAPAPSPAPESGREQQIQRRLAEFHTALQEAERAFRHLEDLQDAFDFCFKVHYQPGEERNRDPGYLQELQSLQAKLQNLDRQRREVLAQMQQLLGRSETLQELLQQELGGWRARQQRQCLGGSADTNLRPLETCPAHPMSPRVSCVPLLLSLALLTPCPPCLPMSPSPAHPVSPVSPCVPLPLSPAPLTPCPPCPPMSPSLLSPALLTPCPPDAGGHQGTPGDMGGHGCTVPLTLLSPQGSKPSPDSTVAWHKFSKDGASGFSFWAWLDGILGLLQEHLKQLWKDGLILGFVSHKQVEKLLRSKRTGTFLLRFSESVLGGVTFTWVEHHETGSPTFPAVEPYTASELVSLALPDIIRDYHMSLEEKNPENPLKFLYPNTPRDEAFGPYYSQRLEGNLSESQKYLNRRLIRVSSRPPNRRQTEEELLAATENLETLQLQPRGQGTPGDLGTPQGVAMSPGTLQVVATSPGTLQVTPGNLGTPQMVVTSPGTLQVVASSPGTLQVTPGNLGTLPGVATSPGTLQTVATSPGTLQVVATSPGTLQVTPGNLGTLPGVATSPGTLQTVATSPGTLQVVATSPGTLQVTPGNLGTPQVMVTSPRTQHPAGLGTLQPQPQRLEPPRVTSGVPNMQGTLQVAPGAVGSVQVLPGGLQMLQVASGDLGTLQGTVEPPRVPEELGTLPAELGTLPAELRDLELLPGGQDMQELLQGGEDVQELLQSLEGLEAPSGTLGTLGVAELMPDVVATLEESFQLSPAPLSWTSTIRSCRSPRTRPCPRCPPCSPTSPRSRSTPATSSDPSPPRDPSQ